MSSTEDVAQEQATTQVADAEHAAEPAGVDAVPRRPDEDVRAAVEAVLFAADEPLSVSTFVEVLREPDEEAVRRALGQLLLDWAGPHRGIWLREISGGYQLRTNPDHNDAVLGLLQAKPTRLSKAAMETLAIIAYRQPTTKALIDEIRGVDCGAVLRSLTDLELIAVIGKADDIGRPNLYGTTRRFLEFFDLNSLTELPTLEQFEVDALELFGEDVRELLEERESND